VITRLPFLGKVKAKKFTKHLPSEIVISSDYSVISSDYYLDLESKLGANPGNSPPYPMGYGGKTRHLLSAGTTISRQSAAIIITKVVICRTTCKFSVVTDLFCVLCDSLVGRSDSLIAHFFLLTLVLSESSASFES
jgi:hypothetical protein